MLKTVIIKYIYMTFAFLFIMTIFNTLYEEYLKKMMIHILHMVRNEIKDIL